MWKWILCVDLPYLIGHVFCLCLRHDDCVGGKAVSLIISFLAYRSCPLSTSIWHEHFECLVCLCECRLVWKRKMWLSYALSGKLWQILPALYGSVSVWRHQRLSTQSLIQCMLPYQVLMWFAHWGSFFLWSLCMDCTVVDVLYHSNL